MTEDGQAGCERRTHDIVWKRPEVTLPPRLQDRFVLGQTNDRRYRARIRDEVHACRQQHNEWLLDTMGREPLQVIPV